jgi:hypothetical protein
LVIRIKRGKWKADQSPDAMLWITKIEVPSNGVASSVSEDEIKPGSQAATEKVTPHCKVETSRSNVRATAWA